jgi:U3 small nucleolar ribonucleoprotein protein IMP4
MTIVTTSRKPLPEVRSLARDLAFAVGGEYITRGKMPMGELLPGDQPLLILSKQGPDFLIQVFSHEKPVASVSFRSFFVVQREGEITRGLFISDRSVYEALKGSVGAAYFGESLPGHRIVFDGTQRRRYTLELVS